MAEIKTYIINDKWTDLDAENNVAVMSVDGEIDKVYVNGTEAGGGGGDFSTAEVTIHFTFSETSDDMTNVNAFVPVCLTDAEISAFPSIPMNDIPSGSTSADVKIGRAHV